MLINSEKYIKKKKKKKRYINSCCSVLLPDKRAPRLTFEGGESKLQLALPLFFLFFFFFF